MHSSQQVDGCLAPMRKLLYALDVECCGKHKLTPATACCARLHVLHSFRWLRPVTAVFCTELLSVY